MKHIRKLFITKVTTWCLIFAFSAFSLGNSVYVHADEATGALTPAFEALLAIDKLSTTGFLGDENRADSSRSLLKAIAEKEKNGESLTTEEIRSLQSILKSLKTQIEPWLAQHIERIKHLRDNRGIAFPNAVDAQLIEECSDLYRKRPGAAAETKPAFDEAIDFLESLSQGEAISPRLGLNKLRLEVKDCMSQLVLYLDDIAEQKKQLDKTLAALEEKYLNKQAECDKKSGASKDECKGELERIADQIRDVEETYTDIEQTEEGGDQIKFWLGVLALAGALVAAYNGDVNTALALATTAAGAFKSAEPKTVEKTVEKKRKIGRERVLENTTQPTPEQVSALTERLAKEGFSPIEYKGENEGVPIQLFSSQDAIALFVGNADRPLAIFTSSNTQTLPNESGVASIFELKNLIAAGRVFSEDSRIRLVFTATNPSGETITVTLEEQTLGQLSYVATVED